MKRTGLVLCLLALGVAPGLAQETPADSLAAEARAEAVRMRGFNRAAETQGTKVLALLDSLLALPPAGGADTVVIEACPEGWTCTPPDTTTPPPADSTAAPAATGVSLMGYAAPDMTHPRDHGLHLTWDDNPGIDYWEVYGGRDDGATPGWGPVEVTENVYRHSLPADAEQALHFACVVQRIDGRPESGPQCDGFDWAPMMRGQFAVTVNVGEPPFAVGDSVNLNLDRVDGGWGDGSVVRPDSVIFETGDVRHREQSFPYEFPCDLADGCLFAVPAADSLVVKWTVFPSPSGSMGGSVAYPVTP